MEQSTIIALTKKYVRQMLEQDRTGHDLHHIKRVYRLANYIAEQEKVDPFVVSLAALLHDIKDHKFTGGDSTVGANLAADFLSGLNVPEEICREVREIILGISFKGGFNKDVSLTPAGKVVQDADRLDAIGAIGVARALTYGGYMGRILYDPMIPPQTYETIDAYLSNESTTINHFYEKLLKLKNTLHTKTARRIAVKRHQFLLDYLQQFLTEWEGLDY